MNHLVRPLQNVTLAECRDRVKAAHDYLVCQAKEALAKASNATQLDDWGTFIKRIRVLLPPGGKPEDFSDELEDHSLTEVYNQCATMERLLDALNWLIEKPEFSQCRVRRCHPTTSSDPMEEHDNDLMLENEQGALCASFEVSDVASSTKDGNQKESKDLVNLGILREAKNKSDMVKDVNWPIGRQLFLIVSKEFADFLRRPTRYWLHPKSGPYCHYVEVKPEGSTRVFRVDRGG